MRQKTEYEVRVGVVGSEMYIRYSLGKALAAIIMVVPGARLTDDEVKAHVGKHLAAFKVPAYVIIQDEQLERGATDKILKRSIRETTMKQLGL